MIGTLYETSLAGIMPVQLERSDGSRETLPVTRWFTDLPGDETLLDRCAGPTLDIGSGPGRLTVALNRRGLPALGIDVTAHAVELSRRAGALALQRDVFDRVPGAGRWCAALLADGNAGIGGDPASLLRRVAELLTPGGRALVEVEPPGRGSNRERVRLCGGNHEGPWFTWAYLGADDVAAVAVQTGFTVSERWTAGGRWFAELLRNKSLGRRRGHFVPGSGEARCAGRGSPLS